MAIKYRMYQDNRKNSKNKGGMVRPRLLSRPCGNEGVSHSHQQHLYGD